MATGSAIEAVLYYFDLKCFISKLYGRHRFKTGHSGPTSSLMLMYFIVGSQNRIDPDVIALVSPLEPYQNVFIEPYGRLLFRRWKNYRHSFKKTFI